MTETLGGYTATQIAQAIHTALEFDTDDDGGGDGETWDQLPPDEQAHIVSVIAKAITRLNLTTAVQR